LKLKNINKETIKHSKYPSSIERTIGFQPYILIPKALAFRIKIANKIPGLFLNPGYYKPNNFCDIWAILEHPRKSILLSLKD